MNGTAARTVGLAIAVAVVTVTASGTASGEPALGPPAVAATFEVGVGPMPDVATDPSTHLAYVTSRDDGSLYVLDAERRVAAINVGPSPAGAAVDSTTQTAYVTSGNSVSVVDIASGATTGVIEVGANPLGIEVDPDTHTVYVANADDGSVSVIEPRGGWSLGRRSGEVRGHPHDSGGPQAG
jgi:YVTN family beta-propeller protein